MKHTQKQWKITGFIPLLALALFAVCLLCVLLTGAGVYKELVARDQNVYLQRTAVQYVSNRIHQADSTGSICLDTYDGISVLLLKETIGDKPYVTYVYCYDGKIRELFTKDGYDFQPGDGEVILDAEELSFAWDGQALSVRICFEGSAVRRFTVTPRSIQEGSA